MGAPQTATTAILFPGQGSHDAAMRATVAQLRPDLLQVAAEACGEDPFERLDEGTRYQQPAILCASLAGWERARHERPALLAGHSLGEFAALVAAGALAERDAIEIVALRGRAMDAAGAAGEPGGMLAVRTGSELARDVARAAGAVVANENAPDQTVLAGSLDALDCAAADLRGRGVRAVRLPVSGAFHSPAMAPAATALREALARRPIARPRTPVISCTTALPFTAPRSELVAALTRPVRWVGVLRALAASGVDRFVETGPGDVLTKLTRKTLPTAEAVTVDLPEAAHA
ncbi:MAG TPA: ACP S-malonyltransferase [Thermoleophilaceae bacterium]|nr:ACP S-malonyltransferase [Thermoleophilaceae bacterium]